MKTIIKFFLFTAVLALVLTGCQKENSDYDVRLKSVTPVKWETAQGGNVECSQLEIDYLFSSGRINYNDGMFDGSFPAGFSVITDGTNVNWSYKDPEGIWCLDGISVIVKGGDAANVYSYLSGVSGDEKLNAPVNASGGPAGLSNLTFCYNLKKCEVEECYIWETETAWGGEKAGPIPVNPKTKKPAGAWWFLYDGVGEEILWAGQSMNAGTVVLTDSKIVITLAEGWYLQEVMQPVKIQGYNMAGIPAARPAAGLFTTYKGDELTIPVGKYDFYAIHLDVMKKVIIDCPVIEE